MNTQISGLHHITAIAGDPQRNIDFYSGVLGLRLVKLTVNFDDPGTYHLYYGDGIGTPGTIITFFPWPNAPGRQGPGLVTAASFAVSDAALDYWEDRLEQNGVVARRISSRFGEPGISFHDPDGMQLDLIASPLAMSERANQTGSVPLSYAIRGFHSATLTETGHKKTAAMLTDTLGFRLVGKEDNRFRYAVASGIPGSIVDVVSAPKERHGSVLVGTVHHIAWRTPSDENQSEWRSELIRLGNDVSPVMDRKYFHSIYFREPGAILFEIATDPPGFSVDEPTALLGSTLVLPPWLEFSRADLVHMLPPLVLPEGARSNQ